MNTHTDTANIPINILDLMINVRFMTHLTMIGQGRYYRTQYFDCRRHNGVIRSPYTLEPRIYTHSAA